MIRIGLFITLVIIGITGSVAWADAPLNSSLYHTTFTSLAQTKQAVAIKIIDPETIQIDTGDIVKLSGMDAPYYHADEIPNTPDELSAASMEILKNMLVGKSIILHTSSSKAHPAKNRMGHIVAQIERKDDHLWVQGALVSLGLGRVRTFKSSPHMAEQLYALEDQARAAGIGLWAIKRYQIKTTTPPQDIPKYSVQIIEGKVQGIKKSKNNIFINFGKDWKTDFTLIIANKDAKSFYRAKIDPLHWNGKTLQARGWVDDYNGPVIHITHPEAVRVINAQATGS